MTVHVLGIRHHGPGSARSVLSALEEIAPDVVLIEGPADAADALPLAAHAEMTPPVALLLYSPDEPSRASYYPFAVYSPEWQALRWALTRSVPVELIDLPQSVAFAQAIAQERERAEKLAAESDESCPASPDDEVADASSAQDVRTDPIGLLADAAGYRDRELWWEEQVERRQDPRDLFAALLDAMRAVREEFPETSERDLLREAHMRRAIRAAKKSGRERIAVVCGAWHAPVLDDEAVAGKRPGCEVGEDAARLKGLPKIPTQATWIPWTYERLTYRSGYGAGVHSPGWYEHLWKDPDSPTVGWLVRTARTFRGEDVDASSASVIESVRLADALAALRDLRAPGLTELSEASLSVFCGGDDVRMRLIRRKLEIGDVLGEVPEETPSVPLARDLARLQKSLRLKASAEIRSTDLDVRKGNDLEKSRLFHRLNLLGVPWGRRQHDRNRTSSFHEVWHVSWAPEFSVALIEANVWGNTIESAATARTVRRAEEASDLSELTALLDAAILASLASAIGPLLTSLQRQAAVASDARHLLLGLEPLARVVRYGDVRGSDVRQVEPILVGMFRRGEVGLPAACSALDEESASRMIEALDSADKALQTLSRDELLRSWHERLASLAGDAVHPLLRGWCTRRLLDAGKISEDELVRLSRLNLAAAHAPAEAAAWATGLLKGSGLALLHQDGLWRAFDGWLVGLSGEAFTQTLPLIRRAYADFSPSERRQMGEKTRQLGRQGQDGSTAKRRPPDDAIDAARADRVLPTLAALLGVDLAGLEGARR